MTVSADAPTAMTARMDLHALTPKQYRAMLALNQSAHDFDPVIRELVKIRASQMNGCAYCIDMHALDARAHGETEQRLYALNAWRETPFFTSRERAALALAEAMTDLAHGHVPDDVYAEVARHFQAEELGLLIWTVVVINAWNRAAVTTRMLPGTYQPRGQ